MQFSRLNLSATPSFESIHTNISELVHHRTTHTGDMFKLGLTSDVSVSGELPHTSYVLVKFIVNVLKMCFMYFRKKVIGNWLYNFVAQPALHSQL